ncbi:MAG: AMP-binding protein [Actinomycetota bacterium]|nr:AMP-binding protein [Actinomycetota bacterium]MDA8207779.1 AMP-binding protein [Actinomycetota bacterium]
MPKVASPLHSPALVGGISFGMPEFLESLLLGDPGRDLLTDPARSLNAAEVVTRTGRLAAWLSKEGVGPGDVVAIFSRNRVEYYEAIMASSLLGISYIPVNWHWAHGELAYVLGDASPRALFVDPSLAGVASTAIREAGYAGRVVALAGEGSDPSWLPYEEVVSAGDLPELGDPVQFGMPMFYTSGTTGRPKGVRGTVTASPVALSQFVAAYSGGLGMPRQGRTLLDGPVYHSAQWLFSALPLLSGSSVHIQGRFDAEATLAAIERHRITNIHMVPTQFVRILKLPKETIASYDLSSIQVIWHGGAPCPPAVKDGILEVFGDHVVEYYGSTELGVNTMISPQEWRNKRGSVGKALPNVDLRIFGEDGGELPQGESGIVAARGQRSFHYHNEPAKTEGARIGDGFSTVGDIGYLDEEGYLFISDRKIDMIISGGVNIYPAEIEAVIHTHPRVLDTAVIGVPDDEFGESVLALVSVTPGEVDEAGLEGEVIDLCREQLAHYKAPRQVKVVEEIPRSLAGKILKSQLRAPYWEGLSRRI